MSYDFVNGKFKSFIRTRWQSALKKQFTFKSSPKHERKTTLQVT